MSPLTFARHRHGLLIDGLADRAAPLARSDHFTIWGLTPAQCDADDIIVVHEFRPEQIDNNIGGYVADELLPLLARARLSLSPPANGYACSEQETFERYVGAIVRSIDGNERRAWHRFYDNTLAALHPTSTSRPSNGAADFNASFRAIYAQVAALVGEVKCDCLLDVATCFGFLPLYLATAAMAAEGAFDGAAAGAVDRRAITGCDLNVALVALAEDYRRTRGIPGVAFVHADILAADVRSGLAGSGGPFDVVTAIHLLEHLTPAETVAAVANLWALTGRRLIVAVPFEDVADPRFGHRQVFDQGCLQALGRLTSGHCQYFEYHGGWLIVDRAGTAGIQQEEQG